MNWKPPKKDKNKKPETESKEVGVPPHLYDLYLAFQQDAGRNDPIPLTKMEFETAYLALSEAGRGIISTDLLIGYEQVQKRDKDQKPLELNGKEPTLQAYVDRIQKLVPHGPRN